MLKTIFLRLTTMFTIHPLLGQSISIINKTTKDSNSKILYLGRDNRLEIKGDIFKGIELQNGAILEKKILL